MFSRSRLLCFHDISTSDALDFNSSKNKQKRDSFYACPQVAGKWYLIGFATNAQWFVSRRDSMKMGTAMLTPTADGDLDMAYASLKSVSVRGEACQR